MECIWSRVRGRKEVQEGEEEMAKGVRRKGRERMARGSEGGWYGLGWSQRGGLLVCERERIGSRG